MKLFIEKGYEDTSLQDIMNETKLSKGGIYHHFASKEEIFEAICVKMDNESSIEPSKIRDNEDLNGVEKLKEIFRISIFNQSYYEISNMMPTLLDNPKFLVGYLRRI